MRRFYTLYEQKLSNLRSLLFITFPKGFRKSQKFEHWTLGSGGKETFKRGKQMQKIGLKKKKIRCGNGTPFMSKSFQI